MGKEKGVESCEIGKKKNYRIREEIRINEMVGVICSLVYGMRKGSAYRRCRHRPSDLFKKVKFSCP